MKPPHQWHFLPPGIIHHTSAVVQVIQSCANSRQLHKGKQLHANIIRCIYPPSTFLSNHLLNMYAKCNRLDYSLNLFDEMPHPNFVSWTALISAFSQNNEFLKALKTFFQMQNSSERPTQFAFSSAIQAAASLRWLQLGKQMHSLSVKSGFDFELYVGSNLADMYFKCGSLDYGFRVFEGLPHKDVVSWTALIDGYTKNGRFRESLEAFKKMSQEGIDVDQYVLCSVLGAYGGLKILDYGRGLHSCVIKMGFQSDLVVGNALTDMYSKIGDMESAFDVCGIDSEHFNVIASSSLVDGYIETDQFERALSIFVESLRRGIKPNEFTFSSLIKGCANQAALEQGLQVHTQVIKISFDSDPFVCSILVDMYGKCGLLEESIKVFDEIRNPTEFSWNSMVGMFGQHGFAKEAIRTFNLMVGGGIHPNEVTFINLLSACSHSGLVEEGLDYFTCMQSIHGIKPTEEHFSCVIDLLGRAGRLREAEEFIKRMPFEPNAIGWCSFLGACRTHRDRERGEMAAAKLMRLEPQNCGTHVLLSNIYATGGQWEGVKGVRKLIRDKKMKKLPGYSWVDVGNKTHVFGVEDLCHPQKKEIYEKLERLGNQIREAGYVPNVDSVPCNVKESLKERLLHHHSERIAVAFALISLPSWKPIIVKKNIRVCVDCHSAIKFMSKVVGRKIIIRDNSRFHHFIDGVCSCRDYW